MQLIFILLLQDHLIFSANTRTLKSAAHLWAKIGGKRVCSLFE